MESTSSALFKLAISLLLINVDITRGQGCAGPQQGWTARPLTDRARQAQTILYGTVRGRYQGAQPSEYNVEMDVKCVMKGNARVERTNITEIGSDCVDSNMFKDTSYIVFVQVTRDGRGQQRFVTHDVNQEMAASRATKENLAAVRRAGVSNQCNSATFEPATDPATDPFTANNPGNGTRNTDGGNGAASGLFASSLCIFIAALYSLTC